MARKKIDPQEEKDIPSHIELNFEQFTKLAAISSVKFKVTFFIVPDSRSLKFKEHNGQAYFLCMLDPSMEKEGYRHIKNVQNL
jgi:hypothetical protein